MSVCEVRFDARRLIAESILSVLLPALFVQAFVSNVVNALVIEGRQAFIIPSCMILVTLILSAWLFRRGQSVLSANIAFAALCGSVMSDMVYYGGTRAPVVAGFMCLAAIASWIYGSRQALFMVLACIGAASIYYSFAAFALMPQFADAPRSYLNFNSALFLMVFLVSTAVPSRMLRRQLETSNAARQKAEKDQELERIRADEIEEQDRILRENEAILSESQKIAGMGVYHMDIVCGVWTSSPGLDSILGIGPDFVYDFEHWKQLVHPDDLDKVTRYFREAVLAKSLPFNLEYRIVRPIDGEVRWLHGYGILEIGQDSKPVRMYGLIQDISERKQAEQQTIELNETLEQRVGERTQQLQTAIKELESFSYSVSHDLRAPLRAIDGYSQVLSTEYSHQLDDEGQEMLGRLRRSAHRMGELIDGLLTLSRVSRKELVRSDIDLSAIVRKVVSQLREIYPGRQVAFIVDDSIRVSADPVLAQAVLENLIDNAWKYSSKCSDPQVSVGMSIVKGKPFIFVRDNGIGFDQAYVGKLFDPFQRLHTQDEYPGTGIGLATVNRIISRHGGCIWAEASPGKGATFYFTFDECVSDLPNEEPTTHAICLVEEPGKTISNRTSA